MSDARHTPGPWEIREALTTDRGTYYTVSRVVNRRRVHLEYSSDGKPMLYSRDRAAHAILAAIAKAQEA